MKIIVSGAGSGIGRDTALMLSRSGKNTVIAVSRTESKLVELYKEAKLSNPNSRLIPIAFDLVKTDYTPVMTVISKQGEIDVLINNAGSLINKSFLMLDDKDWQNMLDNNLISAVKLIRHVVPFMGIKQRGHIVNIGSMGGFQGSKKFDGLSAYSASKAALACLSECLAVEFRDKNISVNCLALGAAGTDMFAKAFPGVEAPIESNEIARYVADFSLNSGKLINGKIIPVAFSVP